MEEIVDQTWDPPVVQARAILFLKSMSKKSGSNIERLWNQISRSTQNRLKMASFEFRVVLCRIRIIETLKNKMTLVWTTLKNPIRENAVTWLTFCWYLRIIKKINNWKNIIFFQISPIWCHWRGRIDQKNNLFQTIRSHFHSELLSESRVANPLVETTKI